MGEAMPVHVRATRLPRKRRSLLFGSTTLSYDVRFADGKVQTGVDIDAVLKGARYPADYHSTVRGARASAGNGVPGEWVDYPYGRRLPADLASVFFARHWRAGLVLPDGWHGTPFGLFYALKQATTDANGCVIELDGGGTLSFTGTMTAVTTSFETRPALQFQGFSALVWRPVAGDERTYGELSTFGDHGTVLFVASA